MVEFAILAVTFFISVLGLVIYFYLGKRNPSTIPGLGPVSKEDGNFRDVAKAGSLHQFLMNLHKQFGPIASFWWGPTYTVSIANSAVFKDHRKVFDRPPVLFKLFEPLLTGKSIQYANGTDGRSRRDMYDKCFTHSALKPYFTLFQHVADEMVKQWDTMIHEHVPLGQFMNMYSLKCSLASLFGEHMWDDTAVLKFKEAYELVWHEFERQVTDPESESRLKSFEKEKKYIYQMVRDLLRHRKENPPKHGETLLLDLLLDYTNDQDVQCSDGVTYIVGSFHTTSNMLTWCFYYLATHPDIQEKLYQEVLAVLGDENVDNTNINELVYLRQVLDETLRCAVVAPYAGRFREFESEIGGHKIPKNTPVIHALGVASMDEKVWPMPHKFDPERFSKENAKTRSSLSFVPFGFAGKRVCPGQKFSYNESTVLVATLTRKFKVSMVEGQVIKPVHGLVTHPKDEVWVTLTKR